MKKIYFLLLLLVTVAASSQESVQKISKSYFRSDPFASEFSSFLTHLLSDPTIKEKELSRRSDTSLFYMHGTYTTFNPFSFKPKKVEVSLKEVEMKYFDSLPAKDTVMIYQIVAFSKDNVQGLKDVQKEFEKIHDNFNKDFNSNKYQAQRSGGNVSAESCNYFLYSHALAPVTVFWEQTEGTNEATLNITIRMKSSYNRAVLAACTINSIGDAKIF